MSVVSWDCLRTRRLVTTPAAKMVDAGRGRTKGSVVGLAPESRTAKTVLSLKNRCSRFWSDIAVSGRKLETSASSFRSSTRSSTRVMAARTSSDVDDWWTSRRRQWPSIQRFW